MDLFLAACTAGDFDLDLERPREAVTFRLEEGGGGDRSRGESRRPPAPTVTVKFSPEKRISVEEHSQASRTMIIDPSSADRKTKHL